MEQKVKFLIGGVQKCGTTALATFLGQHPALALSIAKEAHVFDSPRFNDAWAPEDVNAKFKNSFAGDVTGKILGDATPITSFYPGAIERVARYNPQMQWIILLRDPVRRAISHYAMSRLRGTEKLPLLLAVMLEPWRLSSLRSREDADFSRRKHSYAARGRYANLLDRLEQHFPRENVLVLRQKDLERTPETVIDCVCDFLRCGPMPAGVSYGQVFAGSYAQPSTWSPGVLALKFRLAGELRLLRKRGIQL